jgi:hypothetical protein
VPTSSETSAGQYLPPPPLLVKGIGEVARKESIARTAALAPKPHSPALNPEVQLVIGLYRLSYKSGTLIWSTEQALWQLTLHNNIYEYEELV